MKNAGVRQLRQNASELLRLVEGGETIEITDRGRPVAVLAPLPQAGPLHHLRATGDLVPAERDIALLPPPLPRAAGEPAPSEVLARLRRDER